MYLAINGIEPVKDRSIICLKRKESRSLCYVFICILNCKKGKSKAGLTLNDLYDATCMTHSRFSNFHCVDTNIQVVHSEFIKVVRTDYSAFKSSSKII